MTAHNYKVLAFVPHSPFKKTYYIKESNISVQAVANDVFGDIRDSFFKIFGKDPVIVFSPVDKIPNRVVPVHKDDPSRNYSCNR